MKTLLLKYGITSFTQEELFRKCVPPAELYENILPALCVLQKIRDALCTPVVVHSAYRDPVRNRLVQGARMSLHLEFNALDFSPLYYTHQQIRALYNDIAYGRFNLVMEWKGRSVFVNENVMGLGLYPSFIHMDTRGLLGRMAPSRWG